ncbi:CBS domain-containing protein [Desulfonema limicola]|uniref:CBS domain-containing protein n=1 Tax=Desulfonema limicola TaxID=45656 RepID=A0A975GGT1_9BACT|nr:CBS domain-containing protein [Desulfonema limicola]QTA80532.1 CBS domain-containing protein [Desulfonema limicola]
MEIFAKDIMVKDFDTVNSKAPINNAVQKILHGRLRESGYKTESIMVIDEFNKLTGVISIYDVLFHFRPGFLNYGLESIDVWKGRLKPHYEEFETLTVEQVMHSPVISISPDDHLMVVLDMMVKKRCRRLPVVENDIIRGIVYQKEIFKALFS